MALTTINTFKPFLDKTRIIVFDAWCIAEVDSTEISNLEHELNLIVSYAKDRTLDIPYTPTLGVDWLNYLHYEDFVEQFEHTLHFSRMW